MKITGARNEAFSDMRKRALAKAGAQVRGSMQPDAQSLVFDNEAKRRPDGTMATFKTVWKYNGTDSYDVVTMIPNGPTGQQSMTYKRVD